LQEWARICNVIRCHSRESLNPESPLYGYSGFRGNDAQGWQLQDHSRLGEDEDTGLFILAFLPTCFNLSLTNGPVALPDSLDQHSPCATSANGAFASPIPAEHPPEIAAVMENGGKERMRDCVAMIS